MIKEKSNNMKEDSRELNTIIGKGSVVNGKVSIQNSIRIEGKVIGEVFSSGTVTVGAKGEIEGNVEGINAIIGGKVKGCVTAAEKIVLEANSILIGDLKAVKLTIDEGAMFEGKCSMPDEDNKAGQKEESRQKKEIKEHKIPENE